MIESNRPEENKTSDVEAFFSRFQDGAPGTKAEQSDEAFDKQAKQRFDLNAISAGY
jgi:hypothetical protein